MSQRPTWEKVVLHFSLVEASAHEDRVYERGALLAHHLPTMITLVGSVGGTPAQTVSRVLQDLRDAGIIQFIRAGVYRVLVDQNEALKLLATYTEGRISKGERMIARLLDSMGIVYTREKMFKTMRANGYLRYDFFFVIKDIKFAIEFNGIHHYCAVEYFGGIPRMIQTNLLDKIKRIHSITHNINQLNVREYNANVVYNKIEDHVLNGLEGTLGREGAIATLAELSPKSLIELKPTKLKSIKLEIIEEQKVKQEQA